MPLPSPWDVAVEIIVGIILVLVLLVLHSRRAKPAALQIPSNSDAETVPAGDRSPDADPEIELARRTVAVREEAFGSDHADVAAACHILAAMYLDRGWLAAAEPLLQRVLSIRTRAFGPEHAEVLLTVSDLASLYTSQGRYADAEDFTRRLLAMQQRSLGPAHLDVAATLNQLDTLNQLGTLYRRQGRDVKALSSFQSVLDRDTDGSGARQREHVTAPRDVGAMYREQGKHDEAEEAMKRALEVAQGAEQPGAADDLEVARILADIATLRVAEANPEAAEPLYRRALASLEAAGATDRPELRTVLRELGRLANAKGDYAAAEQFLERALAISERALGPDDREVAATQEDLAWVRFSRRSLHDR